MATLLAGDAGQRVIVDDRPGEAYDRVECQSLTFSPDSQRLAYAAERLGAWFVVLDGQEYGPYGALGMQPERDSFSLAFSPDSQRLAYAVGEAGRWSVHVDGQADASYAGILESSITFSPDGSRLAYVARTDERRWVVVIDGMAGPAFDQAAFGPGGIVFSPDSLHVAYAAMMSSRPTIVIDGQALEVPYDSVGGLTYSSDARLAFAARRGMRFYAVVDGQEGPPFDLVGSNGVLGGVLFSPDGRRVAYPAEQGQDALMVVDGVEGRLYDTVGSPVFSPDGQRLAYAATRLGLEYMVVDGEEGPALDAVVPYPVFSPDGHRCAYVALRGTRWTVIVDGARLGNYDSVASRSVTFSPDGAHVAFVVKRGDTYSSVLDGRIGQAYDRIVLTSRGWRLLTGPADSWIAELHPARGVAFDSPVSLRYVAVSQGTKVLVQERILVGYENAPDCP